MRSFLQTKAVGRRGADRSTSYLPFADPYEPSNLSPFESKALDSSLWEIAALQRHYLSPISSLAKIFSEVFTKPKYGMEDFLDHTYMTVRTRLGLQTKQAPPF